MATLSGIIPFSISLILYIILGPINLILCAVNELVRLCISLYFQSKHNGKITLVPNGADAIWALQRPGTTRMVVTALKTNQAVQKESLVQVFETKVLKPHKNGLEPYKKLKCILTQKLGYACWNLDENFDVRNHVRVMDPQKVYSDEEVKQVFSRLSDDMDETKPQWEVVVLPRFKDKDEEETSLVVLRFQHAYLDGISLIILLNDFLTSNFTYFLHPHEFSIPPWKKFLFYTNAIVYGPYAFLLININKFKSFWPTLPISSFNNNSNNNNNNQVERNFSWTKTLSMTKIRKLRQALDKVSLTTVVENAFISAAKELLPPERLPKEWEIGNLAALLPYPRHNLRNRFTMCLYSVSGEDDDFIRMKKAKVSHWEAMMGPHIPVVYWAFQLAGRFPILMHYIIFAGGSSSVMLSNVPFSKTKVRMVTNNEDVLETYGYPPQPNDTGITIGSFAYQDKLKICASAESDWLKKEEFEDIMTNIPKVIDEWCERLNIKDN